MKKYETPVLEIIQLKDLCQGIVYSQGDDADAKQNDVFFDEDTEEDTGEDLWASNPWVTKYNLWED